MAEKSIYGIAAPLTEALEATVFADNSAAQKSYDMIEKYAYGEEDDLSSMIKQYSGASMKTLAMAEFTFYDSDMNAHTVSIPKITMIPLPLLHVTEATFDMEMSAHIVEPAPANEVTMDKESIVSPKQKTKEIEVSGKLPGKPLGKLSDKLSRNLPEKLQEKLEKTISKYIKDNRDISIYKKEVIESLFIKDLNNEELNEYLEYKKGIKDEFAKDFHGKFYSPSILDYTYKVLEVGAGTTPEEKESTINMKVKIEMKQAELPEGIKLLLQAAAHSLQVAAAEINQ